MFVIESEKDIGLTLEQSVNRSYPFLQMEEGDSFQICSDDEELRRVRSAAYACYRRHPNFKFSVVRDRLNPGFHRCWRLRNYSS